MAKSKIIQYGNPALETRSEVVVDPASQETKDIVDKMMQAIHEHGDGAAGLSAVQLGILKRIAICRRMDLEERRADSESNEVGPIWEIMINPVITNQSNETSTRWEGCLSINKGDLFGRVTRPKSVEVEYVDLEGKKKHLKASDYFAHVVQHEMDHLNGVLFLTYVKDPSELYTGEELDSKN